MVVLGPVGLPAIPNTLYPEGVRLPGQDVKYIVVPQPVFTGRISKSSDIIGPFPVTVKITLKTYDNVELISKDSNTDLDYKHFKSSSFKISYPK